MPFPSPGDLPNPGIKPGSLELQADSLQVTNKNVMRIDQYSEGTNRIIRSMYQRRRRVVFLYRVGEASFLEMVTFEMRHAE